MTDRADTGQMRAASEAIESACQRLQDNTGQIVDLLHQLSNTINEDGTSRSLRRLSESLTQADSTIHQRMLEVGQYLGESATVIEAVLNERQADLDEATQRISSGGKYDGALNG